MLYRTDDRKLVESEFRRMGFAQDVRWRICELNKEFQLCGTYPRFLILPDSFPDADLESVAKFRYFRRVPAAVWRHLKNGCFILRSSQPAIGWFGWFRNELDENLVQAYVCNTVPLNCEIGVRTQEADKDEQKLNNGDSHSLHEDISDSSDTISAATATTVEERILDDNQTSTSSSILNQQFQDLSIEQNNQLPSQKTSNNNNNNNHSSDVLDSKPNQLTGNGTNISPITNTAPSPNIQASDRLISTTNGIVTTFLGNNILPRANLITAFSPMATTPTIASKLLIIDARSYTAAMANRAKGGGCECAEYYQSCEVQFMNLANIHSIRKSFQSIRSVCEAYSEQSNK